MRKSLPIRHNVKDDRLHFYTTLSQNIRGIWKYDFIMSLKNEGRYSFDSPIYLPSVLLPVRDRERDRDRLVGLLSNVHSGRMSARDKERVNAKWTKPF